MGQIRGASKGASWHVAHVTTHGAEVRGREAGERLAVEGLHQEVHAASLLLLSLRGHLAVAGLDTIFLHGQRAGNLK